MMQWLRDRGTGLGAILGLVICVLGPAVLIALDQTTDLFRQVEPPDFIGQDTTGLMRNEVCRELDEAKGLQAVRESDSKWEDLGWPELPKAELVDCAKEHTPATDGTVRYHSCDSTRRMGTSFVPPCSPTDSESDPPAGRVWPKVVNGKIVAADVYIRLPVMKHCTWMHEGGHVRGLFPPPGFDEDENPYVTGGHTERPDHLMGESCGDGLSWLDRTEGGDWPHNPVLVVEPAGGAE